MQQDLEQEGSSNEQTGKLTLLPVSNLDKKV